MRRPKPLQHTAEHWVVSGFAFLMRILPRACALKIGPVLGQLGWWLRVRRRVMLQNLGQAFPESHPRELCQLGARSARNFGRTVVEYLRFASDRQRLAELVTFEGLGALRSALDEGRGALVVTGHLGAWALYLPALANRGFPAALLVGRQHNPKVDRFILGLPGESVEFISKGPGSPRGILRSLKAGKVVIMVADHSSGPRGIFVPFLGRVASTLPLPGAFVARHRLPLFLMMGRRVAGNRHHVTVERLPVPEGTDEGVLRQEVAALCNRAIGDVVLEFPEQYYWFHRRFRDYGVAPAAEPP